jgi:multidrug resistance efflux pump
VPQQGRALAGGLSFGAWGQYSQQRQTIATAQQERDFAPSVRVATVEASPGVISVSLPSTTAAFADANVYARATGYIARRNVDIGDRVKAGDLLAELAVPELDDQISQSEGTLAQLKSTLEQAEANLKLAQVTWDRDRPLVHEGWATQQPRALGGRRLCTLSRCSVTRVTVRARHVPVQSLKKEYSRTGFRYRVKCGEGRAFSAGTGFGNRRILRAVFAVLTLGEQSTCNSSQDE